MSDTTQPDPALNTVIVELRSGMINILMAMYNSYATQYPADQALHLTIENAQDIIETFRIIE